MERLYAPWRHDYVTAMPKKKGKRSALKKDCVFCKQIAAKKDDEYFIVRRFKHCVVMMNYYPYNAGHIMILPLEHKANLHELSKVVRAEMMEAVSLCTAVMEPALTAEGFNVGVNLGSAGGGGLPSHVHIHVLPRWRGDTNFLETIGQTKLISANIVTTFKKLKQVFAKVTL